MTAAPRVILLTTDTPHHRYFAWQFAERMPLASIVVETRSLRTPFEVMHPFEQARDEYERAVLLRGEPHAFEDIAQVVHVDTVNDEPVRVAFRRARPDVTVVFGTGRLGAEVIGLTQVACLNLHGGNPEEYRGLDTHLWAIYHRDFENLVTTLHHVDIGIDTGAVVSMCRLPLSKGMPLHELRAVNAQACVRLTADALETVRSGGCVPAVPQRRAGRYYSLMPAVLKDDCVSKFARHVATL